jgi:hypothetical protein
VSIASSIMRARARAAGPRGSSGGAGHFSSMYSRMIVESKMRVSPSTSAGTSPRGEALVKSAP